jgi:hypothetical protein
MANSYVEYTSLSGTTYATPDYLNINDINVKGYNGSTWTTLTISSRDASAKTITLSAAPSSYQKIRVYRSTTADPIVDFVDGALLTANHLDSAYQQGLFVAQEVAEDAGAVGPTSTTNLSLSGTTTVDNLTATGTVTLPNDSISNANLAGYSEGTWSASLISGGGITFNVTEAKYRKIGTLVFIHIQCSFSGTSSNRVEISGLPFAANETAAMNISHSGGSLPSNASFLAQTHSGHNRLSGNKGTDMTYSDVNGCNMRISGCYVSTS